MAENRLVMESPPPRRFPQPDDEFQLRITRLEIEPPIWRRVVVPQDVPLPHLHSIVQAALGWEDGWKFAGRTVSIERRALPAGNYGAVVDDQVVAVVERKTLENLATSLSDASLSFQLQRLAELPHAAVVVEGDYPDLIRTQPGRGSWLVDMLARLAVRYPEVPVVFAGSRKFAEEWTFRFLGAVAADQDRDG